MTALMTRPPKSRADAVRVREQASQLLDELEAQRFELESALGENGRLDQLKSVTGRSALDNAIQSTRRIIHSIDRYLEAADFSRPAMIAPAPAAVSAPRAIGA